MTNVNVQKVDLDKPTLAPEQAKQRTQADKKKAAAAA
jgi:hypothetical protein